MVAYLKKSSMVVPMCISACVNVNICACEHVSRLLYLDISARIHVCMCASCLFVSVCLCSVPLLFFVAGFVSLGPSLFLSVKQTETNRDKTRQGQKETKRNNRDRDKKPGKRNKNGQGQKRTNKVCQVLQLLVTMCISA